MGTITLSINLIETNPKVRGGRPCLAGTGVRVTDVVMASLFHRQTPDEIAVGLGVPLSHVHAASPRFTTRAGWRIRPCKIAIPQKTFPHYRNRQVLAVAPRLPQYNWRPSGRVMTGL